MTDIPDALLSLPFLPPCLMTIFAVKGPFDVPRSPLNTSHRGVLLQLRGEHQLEATSSACSDMFPPFPEGSVCKLSKALITRFALRLHSSALNSVSVLFLCLNSTLMRRHLRRLPPGSVPEATSSRALYHLEALDRRMAVWKSAVLQDVQTTSDAPPPDGMHFLSLNVQQTLRPKVRALSSLLQSFSYPDVVSLQEVGSLPEGFSIHPLYAAFFSTVSRKCLGVAILIRRDDSYVFHRVDIRSDGHGVAVWFSLAGCSIFAVGLYLPASGPVESYEPILEWVLGHILASHQYLFLAFGDINQNPGWAEHFPQSFSDMK